MKPLVFIVLTFFCLVGSIVPLIWTSNSGTAYVGLLFLFLGGITSFDFFALLYMIVAFSSIDWSSLNIPPLNVTVLSVAAALDMMWRLISAIAPLKKSGSKVLMMSTKNCLSVCVFGSSGRYSIRSGLSLASLVRRSFDVYRLTGMLSVSISLYRYVFFLPYRIWTMNSVVIILSRGSLILPIDNEHYMKEETYHWIRDGCRVCFCCRTTPWTVQQS